MTEISRSSLVAYSPSQMYELVQDIESYPQFLPWCRAASVLERTRDEVTARIDMAHGVLRQSFTTRNRMIYPQSIVMELVEGPFSELRGEWRFMALGDQACKVSLHLHFAFSSQVIGSLIAPVFGQIGNSMVDAFCVRAKQVYGASR